MWEGDNFHSDFLRGLKRRRLDELLSNPERLQSLRYDWPRICHLQKTFATQLEERHTTISEEVQRAVENAASLQPVCQDHQQREALQTKDV